MARLFIAPALTSGLTTGGAGTAVFVRIRESDGAFWNTSGTPAFEAYNASNIADYAITATEIGSTGVYKGTDPADTTDGKFLLVQKAGAALAVSDLVSGLLFEEMLRGDYATLIADLPTNAELVTALVGISGLGTGARTVTVTVNNGSIALESARVRMTKGAESYVGSTNASGQLVFNLDDGTWTVAISLAGHTFAGTTLVVDGTEAPTYSMTAVGITPSDPGQVTGYLVCYDENGDPEVGVEVHVVTYNTNGTMGVSHNKAERTETSDGDGLVQFSGLFPGVSYSFWRGVSTKKHVVLIPAGASDPYELPSHIGYEL